MKGGTVPRSLFLLPYREQPSPQVLNTIKRCSVQRRERIKKNMAQKSSKFGEIIKKLQPLKKMSQTKPHPSVPPPTHQVSWRVFSPGFPRGEPRPAELRRQNDPPFRMAKIRGEGGVICGLIQLINGLIVFCQIQTEDGQSCAAPILFIQDPPNSYW